MANERAILCGDATPGTGQRWEDDPVRLRLDGSDPEVRLCIQHISDPVAKHLPARLLDLVEIATYIYCADQAVTRGGAGVDDMGSDWRRKLHFRIPVRDLEFWRSEPAMDALCGTLGFLSEDEYHFSFQKPRTVTPFQHYLELGDEPAHTMPEEVVLFSGGLDSLGGAVQEIVVDKRRVALVMHRPTEKLRPRHDQLIRLLDQHAGVFRPRYFPVTINKKKGLSREYTQRSRSFLYASIATAIAQLHGRDRIRFYENGVVSLNLPLSPQVVGAKATRTTHPRVLAGFARLFTLICDKPFTVDNPFIWRTKADVVRGIAEAGCGDTIRYSTSCTHTWEMTKLRTHCGGCSQCIDRRFATLAAGQADNDPGEAYKIDLLLGSREKGEHRTMLAAYVETASSITKMNEIDFFSRYGEVGRAVRHLPGRADAAAGRIFDLYRRHAVSVGSVVDEAIREHCSEIRKRELPDSCLLRLVCDASAGSGDSNSAQVPQRSQARESQPHADVPQNEFRRKGQVWLVRFEGKEEFIILPSRGAAYLHLLLSSPGKSRSAAELVASVAKAPVNFLLGDAGERNDSEALTAYRVRYDELRSELAVAEENNDEAGVGRLRDEMTALARELSSTGLDGRSKRDCDGKERVRRAFQMAVSRAINEIKKVDEDLAAHLKKWVRCGNTPVYDPRQLPTWET